MPELGVEGSIVVGKVLEKSGNFGFDAQREEYVDMVTAGIIDPSQGALRAPRQVAFAVITTEAMVAEGPKKIGACHAPRRRHGWNGLLSH